ncbi:hemolysin-III related [compost metagenome]
MIYGIENAMFIETSSGVAQTAAMCAIGLLFYATKIPERFYPGRFDIVLHSHQFWHSTIFVAMLVHLRNMLRVMATFDTHPCYGMKGSFYVDDAPSHFHSS